MEYAECLRAACKHSPAPQAAAAPAAAPWPWKERSPVTHSNMNCTPSRWCGRRNCGQGGRDVAAAQSYAGNIGAAGPGRYGASQRMLQAR